MLIFTCLYGKECQVWPTHSHLWESSTAILSAAAGITETRWQRQHWTQRDKSSLLKEWQSLPEGRQFQSHGFVSQTLSCFGWFVFCTHGLLLLLLTFYICFQSLVTFMVWNKCVASPQLSNDAYGYPMCLNVTSLLFIVMPVTSGVGWGPRLKFFFNLISNTNVFMLELPAIPQTFYLNVKFTPN